MPDFLDRMNVRRARRSLAAFSVACAVVSITLVNWTDARRRHRPEPTVPPATDTRPRKPLPSDFTAIAEVRLGEPRPRPTPPSVRPAPSLPAPAPSPPPVELAGRFQILGLVSGRNGSVILEDLQARKRLVLFVGDGLPDQLGNLVAVEDERAVFRAGATERSIAVPRRPQVAALPEFDRDCSVATFVDARSWHEGHLGLIVRAPPAGTTDLAPGDRLVAVNGRSVRTVEELRETVTPGPARLTVMRDSKTLEIVMRIGG